MRYAAPLSPVPSFDCAYFPSPRECAPMGTATNSPVSNNCRESPGRNLSTRSKEGLMLTANGLYKSYGSVPAVQNVTFTLEPGQVLGYLGPNGSGKSTTVKMLTGLLEPTDGEVTHNGQNIHKDLAAYRKRLGYVPEEAKPLSGLDVTSALIIKNLIQAFSARGKSVFYCSHILEVVEKVCTHLIVLRKGQVIAHGATSEVRERIGTSSLEGVFLHLVEEKDVTKTANEIVDVVVSA